MKETINANIGSLAFTLDRDAYEELKAYFASAGGCPRGIPRRSTTSSAAWPKFFAKR